MNSYLHCVTGMLEDQIDDYSNGAELVEIYGKHAANNKDIQGGIIAMNLKHADGSYFGYYDVELMISDYD